MKLIEYAMEDAACQYSCSNVDLDLLLESKAGEITLDGATIKTDITPVSDRDGNVAEDEERIERHETYINHHDYFHIFVSNFIDGSLNLTTTAVSGNAKSLNAWMLRNHPRYWIEALKDVINIALDTDDDEDEVDSPFHRVPAFRAELAEIEASVS